MTEAVKLGIKGLLGAARRVQFDANALGVGMSTLFPAVIEAEQFESLYDFMINCPELREASRQLFFNRHYEQAVEQAYKCINNSVKQRSGLSMDGQPLMERAFSEHNPVLRLNALRTDSDKNEQAGYGRVFAGCVRGIRNPRAHEHTLKDEAQVALEMLVWANHLMRVLARSKRTRARKHALTGTK